jgi:hypothetical protein
MRPSGTWVGTDISQIAHHPSILPIADQLPLPMAYLTVDSHIVLQPDRLDANAVEWDHIIEDNWERLVGESSDLDVRKAKYKRGEALCDVLEREIRGEFEIAKATCQEQLSRSRPSVLPWETTASPSPNATDGQVRSDNRAQAYDGQWVRVRRIDNSHEQHGVQEREVDRQTCARLAGSSYLCLSSIERRRWG